jgi:hypothetical protein
MTDEKIIEVLQDLINDSDKVMERTGTTKLYLKHSERSLALSLAVSNIQILQEQEFVLWYFPNEDWVKKVGIKRVQKYSGTDLECINKRNELMERLKVDKDHFIIGIKTN